MLSEKRKMQKDIYHTVLSHVDSRLILQRHKNIKGIIGGVDSVRKEEDMEE
jgi:hypothetical protein